MGPNTEADRRSPSDEMDLVARIIAGDYGLFHRPVRPYERDAYLIGFSMFLHPARAEKLASRLLGTDQPLIESLARELTSQGTIEGDTLRKWLDADGSPLNFDELETNTTY
jgi:hypothetical protein